MSWLDALGWAGSALLIYSLMQARVLRFRVLNLAACVILTVFNAILAIWPMVAMNLVLCAINLWFIRKLVSEPPRRTAYRGARGRARRRVPAPRAPRPRQGHPQAPARLRLGRRRRGGHARTWSSAATRPSGWCCCTTRVTGCPGGARLRHPALPRLLPRRVRLAQERSAPRQRVHAGGHPAGHGRRLLRPDRLPPGERRVRPRPDGETGQRWCVDTESEWYAERLRAQAGQALEATPAGAGSLPVEPAPPGARTAPSTSAAASAATWPLSAPGRWAWTTTPRRWPEARSRGSTRSPRGVPQPRRLAEARSTASCSPTSSSTWTSRGRGRAARGVPALSAARRQGLHDLPPGARLRLGPDARPASTTGRDLARLARKVGLEPRAAAVLPVPAAHGPSRSSTTSSRCWRPSRSSRAAGAQPARGRRDPPVEHRLRRPGVQRLAGPARCRPRAGRRTLPGSRRAPPGRRRR